MRPTSNRATDRLTLSGCPLVVHRWGNPQARVIVLLHGFMQSGASWEPVAKKLADAGWQVWAPDFAGHGESADVPADAYSFVAHVDAVRQIAEAAADVGRAAGSGCVDGSAAGQDAEAAVRAGAKPVVWGYSMGGRVAAAFACAHPDAAAAVVVESAGLGPRTDQERQERARKNATLAAQLREAAAEARDGAAEPQAAATAEAPAPAEARDESAHPDGRFAAFVDAWEALPLFESQRSLSAPVRAAVRAERLANRPEALAASLERAGQQCMPDLRPALTGLRVPVLFMAGALDVRYSGEVRALASQQREAAAGSCTGSGAESCAEASFAIVEQAGHNIHLERPDAALEEVMTFLQREGIA